MEITVEAASAASHSHAVDVWRAANEARGLTPGPDRVARVVEKLAASDACVLIARLDGHAAGMTLAEPGREDDGAGETIRGYGHVSMVFVRPDVWGLRIGTGMLRQLDVEARALGWTRLTLWTRVSNTRARRLYEGHGYLDTGRRQQLSNGDAVAQYELLMTTR